MTLGPDAWLLTLTDLDLCRERLKPLGKEDVVARKREEGNIAFLLREIDHAVALHVMLDTVNHDGDRHLWKSADGTATYRGNDNGPWKYATEPNSADRVIERLYALGWLVTINRVVGGAIVNARQYTLPPDGDWQEAILTSGFVQEAGDTISEAVCRAALVAVAKMREPKSP